MNPPYSMKYSGDATYTTDPRFMGYPLAPKSTADYMFILDGLAHLSDDGIMVVLLPHGVLFRSKNEGEIRKKLLEDGNIKAVIGLPEKLFANTAIPTALLVLQKRGRADSVLFVDARRECTKLKNLNRIEDAHIEKILTAYKNNWTIEKYSRSVSLSEIRGNDYNLNIPRYIDTREEEEPVDLEQMLMDMVRLDAEIIESTKEFYGIFKSLVGTNEEAQKRLQYQEQIIQQLIGIEEKNMQENALDMAALKAAKEKQKESHMEPDGLPSDSYQQMTIDMWERVISRESQTQKVIDVMENLKTDFLSSMFI